MWNGNLSHCGDSKAQPGLGTTDLGQLASAINFSFMSRLLIFIFFQADCLSILKNVCDT